MDISFVPLGSRGRHMKGIDSTTITDKISKKLINKDFTPGYHGDSQGYLSNGDHSKPRAKLNFALGFEWSPICCSYCFPD